jgi:D-aminoacyl-tRNA deacylase
VVQRVRAGRVLVGGEVVGEIGAGFVVLVGVCQSDGPETAQFLADKIAHLRIMDDDAGRMDRSVLDVGGEVLVVSQFTLYGDARKGRRPSYTQAARGETAERLYLAVCERLREAGIRVATGRFGAAMQVELVGDGPVTILLDSDRGF